VLAQDLATLEVPSGGRLEVGLRRVKAIEATGIIDGHGAEVSRLRAGLGLTIFVGLEVEGHSQETSSRIEQALLAIPGVVACYLVAGSSDFLVEAAVPDLASYEFTRPLIAGLLARRPARPVRLSATHELVAGAREPPTCSASLSPERVPDAMPNRMICVLTRIAQRPTDA
jgi:DNA-binding Lrp family transcriptional regulator